MAQPPFLVDQIQIEPGSAGTRLISKDSSGELRFQDPVLTLLLSQMAGTRNITGVFIVGRDGSGAAYTSIQDALDDIPSSSSSTDPSVVLVYPGTYQENLTIQRDGVSIIALGEVTLQNDGASPTVTISASVDSTPQSITLRNLTITNDAAGQACIQVVGADAFAIGSFLVNLAPLAIGDTLTIGGLTLTGASCRTSGSNDFEALLGTPTAIAADIAAAINDPANIFSSLVVATPVGASVNLTAVVAGIGGNSITLAASTTPAGGVTPSGATLTGGTAAGSEVALAGLFVEACSLRATGSSLYQIVADTCNNIYVRGGSFLGSAAGTSVSVTNCAKLSLFDLDVIFDVELAYDSGNPQPDTLTSEYVLDQISQVGDVLADLIGVGSLTILSCASVGDLGVTGDRTVVARNSGFGDVTFSDTTSGTLILGTRGVAVTGAGTPTLQETAYAGVQSFVASSSETITFGIPQPDNNYLVLLDVPTILVTAAFTTRTPTSFVISTTGLCTETIGYSVIRQLS